MDQGWKCHPISTIIIIMISIIIVVICIIEGILPGIKHVGGGAF